MCVLAIEGIPRHVVVWGKKSTVVPRIKKEEGQEKLALAYYALNCEYMRLRRPAMEPYSIFLAVSCMLSCALPALYRPTQRRNAPSREVIWSIRLGLMAPAHRAALCLVLHDRRLPPVRHRYILLRQTVGLAVSAC